MAAGVRLGAGLIVGYFFSLASIGETSAVLREDHSSQSRSISPVSTARPTENNSITSYVSVLVHSPSVQNEGSLADQHENRKASVTSRSQGLSSSSNQVAQADNSAMIRLFIPTSGKEQEASGPHNSYVIASSSIMDYNEDTREYILKNIGKPQTRQLVTASHNKQSHKQGTLEGYIASSPSDSVTSNSQKLHGDDKQKPVLGSRKLYRTSPKRRLHLAIPVKMFVYKNGVVGHDSREENLGKDGLLHSTVKEAIPPRSRSSKRIYIPIRFNDDNMLFTTTSHRDCVNCPENYTLVAEQGSMYVQVPIPEISVCPYLAFVPGRLNVAVTSGPRVGSFISEGEYPVELIVWKKGGYTYSCQFSYVVKLLQCSTLPPPNLGVIHCTNSTLWGSQCHVTCPQDYMVLGHSFVKCEGTSEGVRWTNELPKCVSKKAFETKVGFGCLKLHAPTGGTVLCDRGAVGANYSDGTVCQYFCFPDYVFSPQSPNSSLAVCRNGTWSPKYKVICTALHCPKPSQPQRGYTVCKEPTTQSVVYVEQRISTKSKYSNGTVCKFQCEIGYVIPTSQLPIESIVCAAPEWNTSSIPDCKRAVPPAYHPEDCKNKTHIVEPGDWLEVILPRFTSSSGLRVTPSCSLAASLAAGIYTNFCEATDPEFRATSTCSYRIQVIERLTPQPHPEDCVNKILIAGRRGMAILKPTRFIISRVDSQHVIEATCTHSKRLGIGSYINNCSATDPELNTTAHCSFTLTVKGLSCPQLPPISNGEVHCHPKPVIPNIYAPRTTCIFSCSDGYVIINSEKKLKKWKCLSKQLQWSQLKIPKCRKAVAPKPYAKDCHHKTLFLKGRKTIWPKKPKFKSIFKGAKVKVRCSLNRPLTTGLYINFCEAKDVEMRTSSSCTYNITVKAKDCPALPEVSHSDIECFPSDTLFGYQVGVICRYMCHSGYTIPSSLLDHATHKCIAFRRWNSSVLPSCVRSIPPQPTESSCLHEILTTNDPRAIQWALPNFVSSTGMILQSDCKPSSITDYGVHNISCSSYDPELRLNGLCDFTVVVQIHNSIDELDSNGAHCPKLPDVEHSEVKCSPSSDTFGYLVGATCEYECLPGYTIPSSLQHSAVHSCTDLQTWNTTTLPSCFSEIMPQPSNSSCLNKILAVDDSHIIEFPIPTFVSSTGVVLIPDCNSSDITDYGRYNVLCSAYDPELRLNGSCEFEVDIQKPSIDESKSESAHCVELPEVMHSELQCSPPADAFGYTVGTICMFVCIHGYSIPTSLEDSAIYHCTETQNCNITALPYCLSQETPQPSNSSCLNEVLVTGDPLSIHLSVPSFVSSTGVILEADCYLPNITAFGVYNISCSSYDPELKLSGFCEFTVDVQSPNSIEEYNNAILAEDCPDPEPVPNSELQCSSNSFLNHPFSTVCRYICWNGYSIPLHQFHLSTVACTSEFHWNSTETPTCEAISLTFLHLNCPDQSVKTSSPVDTDFQVPEVITTRNASANVSCYPQKFEAFGAFEITCEAYDPYFGITSVCTFVLTLSKSYVPEEPSTEPALNISEADVSAATELPSIDCHSLTSPTNGYLKCASTESADYCNISCNAGFHFPSIYLSLGSHPVICDRSNGLWNFQKDFGITDVPDCLGELPTTSWQVLLKFKVAVENCDDHHMVNLQNEIQIWLQLLNTNVCNITVDCSQFEYHCGEDKERNLITLEITWTVEASFNPGDYGDDIVPNAEIQIEMVLENTQRAITVEQELSDRLFELQARLLQDSYRQGKFTLVCQKRGFIVDPQSEKCVECPSGTFELNGQCKACPANHYQDKTGQMSCVPCPAGTVSLPGNRSPLECKD